MEPAQPVPAPDPPKAPGLAIASLVLGILGFILLFLSSIPAIITGHIALARIRRSQGRIGGQNIAIAGLACGYFSLIFSIFVGSMTIIGFVSYKQVDEHAKRIEARKTCVTIDQAVHSYYDEFGKLPGNGDDDKTIVTAGPGAAKVIGLLYGDNVKQIRFIELPTATDGKGGITFDSAGKPEAILDPWGNPYHVVIDYDYDDTLPNPFGAGKLRGRRVVTFSYGPNGTNDAGKGDDIKSW